MRCMLIDYYSEANLEKVGTKIYQLLYKLPNILCIVIGPHLINHEYKAINSSLIMAPQVRMFPIEIPDLERALFCHLKLKVVEGIGEKYFIYWL